MYVSSFRPYTIAGGLLLTWLAWSVGPLGWMVWIATALIGAHISHSRDRMLSEMKADREWAMETERCRISR